LSSCNEWVRQRTWQGLFWAKYFTVIPVCPFKIVASNEDVLKGIFHLELKDLFHHQVVVSAAGTGNASGKSSTIN
jgi:hypothetical protein